MELGEIVRTHSQVPHQLKVWLADNHRGQPLDLETPVWNTKEQQCVAGLEYSLIVIAAVRGFLESLRVARCQVPDPEVSQG